MPGLTAYFGLLDVAARARARPWSYRAPPARSGRSSARSPRCGGAHRSAVAGSAAKVDHLLDDLGFDAALTTRPSPATWLACRSSARRDRRLLRQRRRPVTDAVFGVLNVRAGSASAARSRSTTWRSPRSVRGALEAIETRSRVQGFMVFDYAARSRTPSPKSALAPGRRDPVPRDDRRGWRGRRAARIHPAAARRQRGQDARPALLAESPNLAARPVTPAWLVRSARGVHGCSRLEFARSRRS